MNRFEKLDASNAPALRKRLRIHATTTDDELERELSEHLLKSWRFTESPARLRELMPLLLLELEVITDTDLMKTGWGKVINTAFDLNGSWTDGSPWVAVIFAGPVSLTIDMSDFERPNANGKIIDSSSIAVTFPDDHAYTGTLIAPNTIRWSNGSTWTKKGV